jgi:iron complex transport system permease protein
VKRPSTPAFLAALGAAALLAVLLGVALGAAPLAPRDLVRALLGRGDGTATAIVWSLRLPRVALGFLVGGVLAVAGAALQALVRNPLADPYLLGLSGGAGLGAVIALAAGVVSAWALHAAAFAGALLAMLVVYRLAVVAGGVLDSRILLLAGVVVGAFAGALLSGLLAVSEAAQVKTATLWLMGGLGGVGWVGVVALAVYAAPALAVLVAEARPLNLLALGEEPAQHLGADVARTKRRVYVAASLLAAASVAAAGMIGFVGLVVPHAIRLVKGHDHRVLLPAAFLLGGTFLVLADTLARTAFAPLELPVGVVTAVVGVPVFAILLRRWTNTSSS